LGPPQKNIPVFPAIYLPSPFIYLVEKDFSFLFNGDPGKLWFLVTIFMKKRKWGERSAFCLYQRYGPFWLQPGQHHKISLSQ